MPDKHYLASGIRCPMHIHLRVQEKSYSGVSIVEEKELHIDESERPKITIHFYAIEAEEGKGRIEKNCLMELTEEEKKTLVFDIKVHIKRRGQPNELDHNDGIVFDDMPQEFPGDGSEKCC